MGGRVSIVLVRNLYWRKEDRKRLPINRNTVAWPRRQDRVTADPACMAWRRCRRIVSAAVTAEDHRGIGEGETLRGNDWRGIMSEVEQDQRQHNECARQLFKIWTNSIHGSPSTPHSRRKRPSPHGFDITGRVDIACGSSAQAPIAPHQENEKRSPYQARDHAQRHVLRRDDDPRRHIGHNQKDGAHQRR